MTKATKYILNDQGEPLACEDVIKWGTWFEKGDRRVALTVVDDPENDASYSVSTVFLGLDYGWGSSIHPVKQWSLRR
jgi:hypothetical protein